MNTIARYAGVCGARLVLRSLELKRLRQWWKEITFMWRFSGVRAHSIGCRCAIEPLLINIPYRSGKMAFYEALKLRGDAAAQLDICAVRPERVLADTVNRWGRLALYSSEDARISLEVIRAGAEAHARIERVLRRQRLARLLSSALKRRHERRSRRRR